MKAIQYSQYGGPEVLQIVELEKPEISENKLLIEVFAVSINPFDYKVRRGMVPGMPDKFPITIGGDFSGKIVDCGKEIKEFQVGDSVYGQASYFSGATGSFAQYVLALPEYISLKPENLDFMQSASLPLTGASAIQAIEDHIELRKNQKILIHGGTGGIGALAVQLSKYLGAYVITTVSEKNMQQAKNLGADEVIDYKNQKFEEIVKDVDAVFNTADGTTADKSFQVLKKGGILVSMTSSFEASLAEKYAVRAVAQNSKTTTQRLKRLKELVEKNVLKPEIDKIFEFSDFREAFSYQEMSHPTGKVVLKIKNS